jgi:hypothetical protein
MRSSGAEAVGGVGGVEDVMDGDVAGRRT